MSATNTTTTFRLFAAAAMFALVLGCTPAPDTGAEYRDEANDSAVLTAQERSERRNALDRKWQATRERLHDLRMKTNADGIQNEWDEAAAKIDLEASELERKLDEFGDDSRQAWSEFETQVESELDEMGREIDHAVQQFE